MPINLGERNKESITCQNCVMDTSDQNIVFDEKGICDHCNNFWLDNSKIWEQGINGERVKELYSIAKEIKKNRSNLDYDCLLGFSGGPDSSYMLHLCVTVLGLKPLVFHVDGGWNSKDAVYNIKSLVNKLGVDLHVTVIDWDEMKSLQRAFFYSGVSHLDTPQDHAFFATMYRYAEKHDIKYIFNGGNISTEALQVPLDWMYYATDSVQLKSIHNQYSSGKLATYPISSVLNHKIYLRYFKNIKVIRPLDYYPYLKEEATKELRKEYNWKSFEEKHYESNFTRFYEGFWLPARFGYDHRKVALSSLILTGQISRREALVKLEKPSLSGRHLNWEKDYIANKLDMSLLELENLLTIEKKSYRDYPNMSLLYKSGAKILRGLNLERRIKR